VDRATALGNPYVVHRRDSPSVRHAACAAYRELLSRRDVWDGDGETVVAIGEAHGFRGEVRSWRAERAVERLAEITAMARQGRLRLDCSCAPLECHAWAIAERVMEDLAGAEGM
jgi:hypothetical protein